MARGLNKVMLIGNLGADPEIRYAASGIAVANVSLATTDKRKNRSGEWEEQTEWHRLVMFGKNAENAKDYLKKGSRIYAEGRIQTRSWDGQDGQKRYSTEIAVNSFIMLDSKGNGRAQGQAQSQGYQPPASPPPGEYPEDDDSLLF